MVNPPKVQNFDCPQNFEVKSYASEWDYNEALKQAARYGKQMEMTEIFLAFFVEKIDPENRKKYEADYIDKETGVTVKPLFINTH